jgi:DnaK suppressor protein
VFSGGLDFHFRSGLDFSSLFEGVTLVGGLVLDADMKVRFRALLESEREKIMANTIETIKNNELELSADEMSDENDMASALYDQSFTLRMRDRERMLFTKIDKALKRIDEDEYGYCAECDDDIALPRLEARPVTTLCIACKEEQERHERSKH